MLHNGTAGYAATIAILIKALSTVLRHSGLFKVNDGRENAQDEQRKPQVSYSPPLKNPNTHILFPARWRRDGLRRISPTGAFATP
ncbi:MAG: hypothetical protein WAK67_16165 [Xanthobacteraceae bacterium]|jgi:hypothetical protein